MISYGKPVYREDNGQCVEKATCKEEKASAGHISDTELKSKMYRESYSSNAKTPAAH